MLGRISIVSLSSLSSLSLCCHFVVSLLIVILSVFVVSPFIVVSSFVVVSSLPSCCRLCHRRHHLRLLVVIVVLSSWCRQCCLVVILPSSSCPTFVAPPASVAAITAANCLRHHVSLIVIFSDSPPPLQLSTFSIGGHHRIIGALESTPNAPNCLWHRAASTAATAATATHCCPPPFPLHPFAASAFQLADCCFSASPSHSPAPAPLVHRRICLLLCRHLSLQQRLLSANPSPLRFQHCPKMAQ